LNREVLVLFVGQISDDVPKEDDIEVGTWVIWMNGVTQFDMEIGPESWFEGCDQLRTFRFTAYEKRSISGCLGLGGDEGLG
jgi:hypothetical protein